jgi:hypothetical protein
MVSRKVHKRRLSRTPSTEDTHYEALRGIQSQHLTGEKLGYGIASKDIVLRVANRVVSENAHAAIFRASQRAFKLETAGTDIATAAADYRVTHRTQFRRPVATRE